ncbi:MAG TPA: outer membrane protein assembly factor BamA [Bacteroidetes bacterium]|nr:outer membrane protein assembly factor BamA [Bacteroidota bacterium]
MKRIYTATFAFLVSVLSVSLSAQVLPQQSDDSNLYTIAGVTVRGNSLYASQIIIHETGLVEGSKVRIPGEQISSAIRRLWKHGLFDNVEIYVDRVEGDKVYLEIEVLERTPITRLRYEGVSRTMQEDMAKDLNLNANQKVSEDLIQSVKNYIEKRYIKRGFLSAKVNVEISEDTLRENGGVYMKIILDKGERVRINSINFQGNQVLTADQLRKAMKDTKQIKHLNVFKQSKLVEDKYEDDLKNIVEKYKTLGYRDARVVGDTITWNRGDNTLDINIAIDEGNKYHYRSIKFLGNSKFSTEQLETILGIKEGDVYNGELLAKRISGSKDGRDIQSLYMDNGYLFAQIMPVEVSADRDSIDLEIRIIEYDKAYINRVTVKGNTRTFDEIIYRELTTKPGDLFSKTAIMQSQQRIGALGFFDGENIGIDPKPNLSTGTVDIDYTVVEKNSSQIELQGGWGGGMFIGTVGLSFNNFSTRNLFNKKAWKPLPMGQGQTFSLRFQAAQGYTSYQMSFMEPWIGGRRPLSITTSFYYTKQEAYNYYTNERMKGRLDIFGGGIVLGKRLNWPDDYFVGTIGINYSRYGWKDYNWGIYQESFTKGTSNNLNLSLGLNRRSSGSNPIYPTYGSDISLSLFLTPPYSLFNGRDYSDPNLTDVKRYEWLEYYKFKAKATWYNNIAAKLVLVTNVEFGYMGMYNHKVGLGPFERFIMGGSGMSQYQYYSGEIIPLRGYKDNTIASSNTMVGIGDPIYNRFTVELRYPITLSQTTSIFVLLFAEGGNTYADLKSYNPFKLHRSTGAGIRVFMPMFGMLGFDFGYGFDPMPGEKRGWQFHFSLGQQLF